MDSFASLMQGFAVALRPDNLLYCVIGCLWGTVVGVLPGLGPLAGPHAPAAAHVSARPDVGA